MATSISVSDLNSATSPSKPAISCLFLKKKPDCGRIVSSLVSKTTLSAMKLFSEGPACCLILFALNSMS